MIATTVVLLSIAAELAIRELYYRLWAELPRLVLVACVWLAIAAIIHRLGRSGDVHRVETAGRIGLFVSLALWLDIVGDTVIAWLARIDDSRELLPAVGFALFALGAWYALRLPASRWAAVRRAACAIAFLFVASQPIVAAINAPTIRWPERRPAQPDPVSAAAGRDITVFLLLDELNATAAAPLVDALAKAGRGVQVKSLLPVGDATAKVLPAMFAGGRFPDAKPCGIDTVCSGGRVLDFSKVIASRADVDVVGFYEPYCAIRGLRSCVHASPSSPALAANRWWCAALRRSIWLSDRIGTAADQQCAELVGATWSQMVSGVERALATAPVWREGGVLFAHVPLPHPPGEGGEGSLPTHYSNNIARAVRLVDGIVQQLARQPDRRVTIIVFSDHPLRSALWCSSTQYRRNGCPLPQNLVDDKVPLIVAGDVPPAFDSIRDNGEVFRLADR